MRCGNLVSRSSLGEQAQLSVKNEVVVVGPVIFRFLEGNMLQIIYPVIDSFRDIFYFFGFRPGVDVHWNLKYQTIKINGSSQFECTVRKPNLVEQDDFH